MDHQEASNPQEPKLSEPAAAAEAPDAPVSSTSVQDRPSDEAILQQQNHIRADIAQLAPYIGSKLPLASLQEEYVHGNEVFVKKIQNLEHKYSHIRRTRGDGNCFFRAFIFSYLENLLNTSDKAECTRMQNCIQGWQTKLVDVGFQELVFEDAMGLLLQQVNGILHGNIGQEALEGAFQDDMISNTLVFLMRLITSAEIQRREDHFLPFILGMYDEPPPSVSTFTQRYVEPMAEESDNIHIVALTDALQVPVTVVYLDRSEHFGETSDAGDMAANVHQFIPSECGAPNEVVPRVHALYRPGHFDILYARV